MDPSVCFARILDALAVDDYEEAFYACGDLIAWIEHGGVCPKRIELALLRALWRLLKSTR